jgi:hypothetical protein
MDHVIAHGFARPEIRRLYTIVSDVDQVLAAIHRQPEPALPDRAERL